MNTRDIMAYAFGAPLLLVSILGCLGAPDLEDSSYPREVSIEYIVSSSSPEAICDITYTNDTGGDTSTDAVALPYEARVDTTIEAYDLVRVMAYCRGDAPDDLTVEIKVDGVSVEREVQVNKSNAWLTHFFD